MKINFNTITGKIKPMHAINNMPMIGAFASDETDWGRGSFCYKKIGNCTIFAPSPICQYFI